MHIFVSYHTPDSELARRLVDALKSCRQDLEFYFAPRVNLPGAYWLPALAKELEKADVVLFLGGERVGPWQEVEYHEALRLSKNSRHVRPRIIPIISGKQAPGLPFFNLLQQIFATDPSAPDPLAAILAALDGVPSPDAQPFFLRFNPYKGLAAFTTADAAYFFGRERLSADILTALADRPTRALALVGSSGVGKSSLAQAGVIAALKSQQWPGRGDWPAALADSRRWLPLTVRPEDQPLKSLALAFTRLMVDGYQQDREALGWAENFRKGSRLGDLIRAAKDALAERLGSHAPARFVLYVDQGEELYATIFKDGKRDEAAAADAALFSALLSEAALRADIQVLLSMRSDFTGHLEADTPLFDASDIIHIPPMGTEALQQAIRRPAQQLGVRFLPEEMPAFLAGATARESGALPLLAYLLSDLWQDMQARGDGILRWDDSSILDVSAALRERAERFRAQNTSRDGALRRLFTLRLARVPRLGDVIRRRARQDECNAEEWRIAEALAGEQWRLVTLSGDDADEVTAEVAHEQILRTWPTLVTWLQERREFLIWKADVEQARLDFDDVPEADKREALLTGRRLHLARQWVATHGEDLGVEERTFIAASIKANDELRERVANQELRMREQEEKILLRTRIGAGVAVLLALLAGWFGYQALQQAGRAEASARQSEQNAANANLAAERAAKIARDAQLARARSLAGFALENARRGDPENAVGLARQALVQDPDMPDRPMAPEALTALYFAYAQKRFGLRTLRGHAGEISNALELKDGRILTTSNDKTARLWTSDGTPSSVLEGHEDRVYGGLELKDGRLFTWSRDKTARLWTADGSPGQVLKGHSDWVWGALELKDGGLLTWSQDSTARLWTSKGTPGPVLAGHGGPVLGALELRDGRVMTWSHDKTARLWAADGTPGPVLGGHEGAVPGAIELKDGRLLTWSEDNTARLWGSDGTPKSVLKGHEFAVSGALELSDSRLLTWGSDKTVRLWAADGTAGQVLTGHEGSVWGVRELTSGGLLTWGEDKTARLWAPDGSPGPVLKGHDGWISGSLQLKDSRLLSWSIDSTLRLWAADGTPAPVLKGHEDSVSGALELHSGRLLTWSEDLTMRLWSADGTPDRVLKGHEGTVSGVMELNDGRIISWSNDKTARLWGDDGSPGPVLKGHDGWVSGVLELKDGRLLTWSEDKTIRFWAADGTPGQILDGHHGSVWGALELKDGRLLSWSEDRTARLWAADGTPGQVLMGGDGWISGAMELKDRRLLTWGSDRTVRLWGADGTPAATLRGHENSVSGALELEDGRLLTWGGEQATTGEDKTAHLWTSDGTPGPVLKGHDDRIDGALELRDRRVLTWSTDSTARLWTTDGTPGPVLKGHNGWVFGALEMRDGRLLVWSQDKIARLWASDGTPGPMLEGHEGSIWGALELRDGRILTWSQDKTARLWVLPERLLAWADRYIEDLAPLSASERCQYYLDPDAECARIEQ